MDSPAAYTCALPPLEPAATGGPAPPTRIGPMCFIFGPVVGIFRPVLAARLLVAAPRGVVIGWFIAALVLYSTVLIGLSLWAETLVLDRGTARLQAARAMTVTTLAATEDSETAGANEVAGPLAGSADETTRDQAGAAEDTTSAPATTTAVVAGGLPAWSSPELRERSIAEIWSSWHENAIDGWLGVPVITALLVLALGGLTIAVLAWLNLPFVHRTGRAMVSYVRSLRIAVGVLWPLCALTLLTGLIFVPVLHGSYRGRPFFYTFEAFITMFWCVAGSWVVLVVWITRALAGAAAAPPATAPPPRCEGCGYDLRHLPASGRCPECGSDLDGSLCERTSRPGECWTATTGARRTPAGWFMTAASILLQPQRFYRRLKLRVPEARLPAFVAWNYAGIGLGAACWFMTTLLVSGAWRESMSANDLATLACVAPCMIVLGVAALWVGHRAIAATVFTFWLLRRELPDYRWASRIIQYETPFLWAICAHLGFFFASFILFENWISWLLGLQMYSGFGELAAIWAGLIGLVVLWFVRYQIAYRAIRWSNF